MMERVVNPEQARQAGQPQQGSLPLFRSEILSEAYQAEPGRNADQHPGRASASGPEQVNQHLKAARALSRKIRQYPDRSPEQTVAGRAICQHLRAFLREAEAERLERVGTTPH